MKQATLTERRSGESLEVKYDPAEDRFFINDAPVKPVHDFEGSEDDLVFAIDQPELGATGVYHLSRHEVEQLQGSSA
ncbi:MAG: hypothetical protein M3220_17275 [Chloroflexota bacterium]|nr:hypothetical protein [Chloroflexota bacterium]